MFARFWKPWPEESFSWKNQPAHSHHPPVPCSLVGTGKYTLSNNTRFIGLTASATGTRVPDGNYLSTQILAPPFFLRRPQDYEANLLSQGEHLEAHPPADNFVHWCLDHGVELVVRANRGTEPGLRSIGGTYDPQVWKDVGINHLDVPFEDKWGAVPSRETVRSVLTSCRTALSSAAVLLQSKGGFGRSVMLASCLVIYEYDVPGRSVLGWCRIARPGAVTTPQQELFLSALKGRDDVERYANRNSGSKCLCSLGAGLVRC